MKSPRGFSLLEVLVASAITIVVLTAAACSLAMAMRFVAERRLRITAEMVAESHMELLLAIERDRHLVAGDCAPVLYTRDTFADAAGDFDARCTVVVDTPATATQRYNRLDVVVSTLLDGRRVSATFSTYVVKQ